MKIFMIRFDLISALLIGFFVIESRTKVCSVLYDTSFFVYIAMNT